MDETTVMTGAGDAADGASRPRSPEMLDTLRVRLAEWCEDGKLVRRAVFLPASERRFANLVSRLTIHRVSGEMRERIPAIARTTVDLSGGVRIDFAAVAFESDFVGALSREVLWAEGDLVARNLMSLLWPIGPEGSVVRLSTLDLMKELSGGSAKRRFAAFRVRNLLPAIATVERATGVRVGFVFHQEGRGGKVVSVELLVAPDWIRGMAALPKTDPDAHAWKVEGVEAALAGVPFERPDPRYTVTGDDPRAPELGPGDLGRLLASLEAVIASGMDLREALSSLAEGWGAPVTPSVSEAAEYALERLRSGKGAPLSPLFAAPFRAVLDHVGRDGVPDVEYLAHARAMVGHVAAFALLASPEDERRAASGLALELVGFLTERGHEPDAIVRGHVPDMEAFGRSGRHGGGWTSDATAATFAATVRDVCETLSGKRTGAEAFLSFDPVIAADCRAYAKIRRAPWRELGRSFLNGVRRVDGFFEAA